MIEAIISLKTSVHDGLNAEFKVDTKLSARIFQPLFNAVWDKKYQTTGIKES